MTDWTDVSAPSTTWTGPMGGAFTDEAFYDGAFYCFDDTTWTEADEVVTTWTPQA